MAQTLSVSPKTLYYWVGRREVPFLKVGRHLRFDPVAVVDYFAAQSPTSGPICRGNSFAATTRARSLKTGPGSLANSTKE